MANSTLRKRCDLKKPHVYWSTPNGTWLFRPARKDTNWSSPILNKTAAELCFYLDKYSNPLEAKHGALRTT